MNNSIRFLVEKKNNNKRIDIFLSQKIQDYTRSYIRKLIKKNHVKLNKAIINLTSTKIKTKDEITINIVELNSYNIKPKNIN